MGSQDAGSEDVVPCSAGVPVRGLDEGGGGLEVWCGGCRGSGFLALLWWKGLACCRGFILWRWYLEGREELLKAWSFRSGGTFVEIK